MDELTLGLIGAGAVVVGGVVVYNAWQGAKVRRKMPRPMPDEAAESLARSDDRRGAAVHRTDAPGRGANPPWARAMTPDDASRAEFRRRAAVHGRAGRYRSRYPG